MGNQTLTVKQVLDITARNLESISVPVGLIQTIGVPLMNSVENIRKCIIAISEPEETQEEPAEVEEEN